MATARTQTPRTKTAAPRPGERLQALLTRASRLGPVKAAVVHPVSAAVLQGVAEAVQHGLIEPVLVGPQARIRAAAKQAKVDIRAFASIDTEHSHAAAQAAVLMARRHEVSMLVKGSLPTEELMQAILQRDTGIRTDRRMSHVFVIDSPAYHKLLVVTDAAINIDPDLAAKRDIAQNAIDLLHRLGVKAPKVAVMSAVEFVNPNIPSTLHAAALCKMADRGQISGAILDGPLALDNAISREAAKAKGIDSAVAGDPDVLLVPDLESGNMLAKQFLYFSAAQEAGLLLGARVPVVLTSRSEGALGRLYSCAIAALCCPRLLP